MPDLLHRFTKEIIFSYTGSDKQLEHAPKLSKVKLTKKQLINSDFEERDFYRSDLSLSMFAHSKLKGAQFEEVTAVGVDFSHCDLRGANFRKAKLDECLFIGANLEGANFWSAEISCDFRGANIKDVDFGQASMLGKGIKKNTGSDGTKISASKLEDFLKNPLCKTSYYL